MDQKVGKEENKFTMIQLTKAIVLVPFVAELLLGRLVSLRQMLRIRQVNI